MRLRTLGAALLNAEVVILFVSGVAAVASVLAWTGSTVAGGAVAAAIVLLVAAAIAFKVRALYGQGETRRLIALVMAAGMHVLERNVKQSPGAVRNPGEAPAPRPEDAACVEAWEQSAAAFIAREHPEFLPEFLSDANLFTAGSVGKHHEFDALRDRIEFRLARLAQLLRRI